ncbi:Toluene efflux pump periplasmic linker protein TtgA precursor [Botrimarina colliarenosi]|uniref:Toluene efflux pump periplasmic linker protein TtgA n=1 Tax=Botrimarina colliarenosi TaxID=2528001 RepID=A0A5C6A8S7_9BACT|nr:efflux RND transporter periplasmic adaptor subunit [Botrimarina colliarenosi]TWT95807.1 Toluene efflux pump periplasmic linker protein TtgA precursor [Botrimarina colliarenosi]
MTQRLARLGRFTFLVLLTIGAACAMWYVSQKSNESDVIAAAADIEPPRLAAQPRTLVKAVAVEPALRDVVVRYSGKIQAWETYSLGFEIGGRVATLGVNARGEPLDDGDRVEAGQVLARLDDRVLRARVAEAIANFEMAASDVERNRRARAAITDSEFQNAITLRAQAQAAQEVTQKNLEDSVLLSPVSGVIARRLVEAGESVNPNETIYEVVENDRLRLVVNVPEARVRELELRRRQVTEARRKGLDAADPESGVFRAHVRLEGADLYGADWPAIEAQVYRVAQRADTVTGLFEVEVVVDNDSGLLRPGMVATAEIVTDRVLAYSAPESAVLFRSGQTYLFTVEDDPVTMPVMFWDVGESQVQRARRVNLDRWIDQGESILIPADATSLGPVVTRGQERLRDGQLVRVTADDTEPAVLSRASVTQQK